MLIRRHSLIFWGLLFMALLAARLCHVEILWADEDYHQAAAIQILHGKMLYRDIWYDKPPVNALVYLLFGAQYGWAMRLASALYGLLVCVLAFRFSSELWTRREGYWAAALFAFCLVFYFPGATLTLEPDTLLLAPHLTSVYLAWRGRALAAGIAAGVSMCISVKGVFVLAACALFGVQMWPLLSVGFLIPVGLQFAWLGAAGAFGDYFEQVWKWGMLYAASALSVGAGLLRLANWFGFHSALVAGAVCFIMKREPTSRWWIGWFGLSLVAAGVGWRFLPRYLDQLLPPLVIVASRGWALLLDGQNGVSLKRKVGIPLCVLTLAIPAIRFGPRYVTLASDLLSGRPHRWADIAMDQESRAASQIVQRLARNGDTIFIWGYRPNVVAYTRLAIAGRFWDSQPLTGVPADRHLSSAAAIASEWAAVHRAEFIRSQPTFLVDGLSLYNSRLDINKYPDLAEWLTRYCEVGRTGGMIVYQYMDGRASQQCATR